MRVGISIPNMGPLTSPEILLEIAERAEQYHFSDLWVGDHIIFPAQIRSRYPYPGGFSSLPTHGILEPLVAMSYLGGITKDVRLGVSVLIVPYRNPVVTAKMIATLDVLTGGRVILGAGVGWMAEEFQSVGADYEHRGAVTDEYIRVYQNLCTAEEATFSGKYYRYENLRMAPKPVQKPYPPVWIGGTSMASIRRAANVGDGWQRISITPDEVKSKGQILRGELLEKGRNPESFVVCPRLLYSIQDDPPVPSNVPTIHGTSEDVLGMMRRYEEAGADHILMSPQGPTREKTVEYVDRLGEDVLGRL